MKKTTIPCILFALTLASACAAVAEETPVCARRANGACRSVCAVEECQQTDCAFVDEDGDGICDNKGQRQGKRNGKQGQGRRASQQGQGQQKRNRR